MNILRIGDERVKIKGFLLLSNATNSTVCSAFNKLYSFLTN